MPSRYPAIALAAVLGASACAQEPLAHWTMDSIVEGAVLDVSGHDRDAMLGPEGVEPPEIVPGMVGDALRFVEGKQHFLAVEDSSAFNFDGPFTVMAWVKPTRRNAAFSVACFKGDKSGEPPWPGWRLRFFWARAYLQVGTIDGTEVNCSSAEWTVPAGYWSHITGSWDGTHLRVFVNAVEKASTEFAGEIAPQPRWRQLTLGNYLGRKDAYAFDGLLDDIKIFDRALTEEEVLAEAAPE